ncbi:MAG: hypothetical protein ACR2P1_09310 [Pseudomonadales bacterium]
MSNSTASIVHREVIELQASPPQVREFIMTPQRILDYYPSAIEGHTIIPCQAIVCRGKSGVSLLEVITEETTDQCVVVKVTTATKLDPPYSADRIKAAAFFTMIEDWALEETPSGTRLTKTWREIQKKKLKLIPIALITRFSAKSESEKLRVSWNKASQ